MCIPSVVFAINLNGSWSYRESGNDNSETFREFRQNYSFGVGPALSYSPSHAIKANLSVGYTQNNNLSGQDSQIGRIITPTAGVALENDLFVFRISGHTKNSQANNGNWSSSSAWSTSLNSRLIQPFIPRLSFRYSETGQDSNGAPISSLNTQSSTLGAGVDLDLQRGDVSYRYTQTAGEDRSSNQSHFVKLQTAARFWDNRISMRLSQQAQFAFRETDQNAAGAEDPIDDRFLRYAISTVVDEVAAECSAGLIPGETCPADEVSPISYAPNSYVQLAIRSPSSRQIGVVEISYDIDDLDFRNIDWNIYEINPSAPIGTSDWTLIQGPVDTIDLGNGRLRIEIAEAVRTDQEILLVSNMQGVRGGDIFRVDVYEVLPGGTEFMTRNYNTSAGISVRLTDSLSSSLGLTYIREERESEGAVVDSFNSDQITTSGSLSWRPFSFLSTSAGVTEYRERELGEEQVINRNYSISVSSRPTETMNISFSTLLNERFGGSFPVEQKTIERLSYLISGKAQIYPDLTASFSLSQDEGKRWLEEEIAGVITGRFADESGYSGRLNLQADLFEDFTVDFIGRYSQTETDGTASESGTIEMGLRYRVSDLLLLRSSYKTELVDSDRPDTIDFAVLTSVLNTGKTRLDVQLRHTQTDEATQRISVNGSWELNKNVSLTGRGGYSIAEVSSYFMLFDLRVGI